MTSRGVAMTPRRAEMTSCGTPMTSRGVGMTPRRVQPLDVRNVTVRFRDTDALADVSHSFLYGTATAIVGSNGSGKTTLLESIAGIQRITSGDIQGVPRKIAYVRQHPQDCSIPITVREVMAIGRYRETGIMGRLKITVREVMATGRYRERGIIGSFRASERDFINTTTRHLDVDHLMDHNFDTLSGGQRQRVRIAQALVSEPDLVMLDEPLTGLDIPSQERILKVITDCCKVGKMVILTTHQLDVARHCDQVMLLSKRLIAAGSSDEMLTIAHLREVFGTAFAGDVSWYQHAGVTRSQRDGQGGVARCEHPRAAPTVDRPRRPRSSATGRKPRARIG